MAECLAQVIIQISTPTLNGLTQATNLAKLQHIKPT